MYSSHVVSASYCLWGGAAPGVHFQCLSTNTNFYYKWVEACSTALTRTIHSFPADLWTEPTEDYLVRAIWLCFIDPARNGGEVVTVSVIVLCLSLSLLGVTLPYLVFVSADSLQGEKPKSWMLILEELTQQRLRDHLLVWCLCVCEHSLYVMVHMLGSGPSNGVMQQQNTGCGQLILVWAEMAGFQPFYMKIGPREIW